MAKQKKETKTNTVPEGYERTSPPRGAQNWIKFEEGLRIEGVLLGRFEKKDRQNPEKMRSYYEIELTKACTAWRKPDQESKAEEVDCGVGEHVCIDEKYSLQCMGKLVSNGAVYQVVIIIGDKTPIGGGQSLWQTEVFHKKTSRRAQSTSKQQEDDIPF